MISYAAINTINKISHLGCSDFFNIGNNLQVGKLSFETLLFGFRLFILCNA